MKLFSCFFLSLSFIFINLIDSKLTSFEGHNPLIVKRHTFVRAREMTFNQCDQMARLLVNIWPLKPIKICPIASFFTKVGSTLCQIRNYRCQKLPKTSKYCQSVRNFLAKFCHTAFSFKIIFLWNDFCGKDGLTLRRTDNENAFYPFVHACGNRAHFQITFCIFRVLRINSVFIFDTFWSTETHM